MSACAMHGSAACSGVQGSSSNVDYLVVNIQPPLPMWACALIGTTII